MKLISIVAAVAALQLSADAALAAPTGKPKLDGSVGPGYTIALKRNGKLVRRLHHGKYRVSVSDRSTIHDFTISGPHLPPDVVTGDGFTGTKTVTIALKPGKYEYFCIQHEQLMSRSFRVY